MSTEPNTPEKKKRVRLPPSPDRATYSIEEVGDRLGISRNSAYTAAKEGKLPVPVITVGGRKLVSKAALDRVLAGVQ